MIKIFIKIGISINKRIILACHRLGKTTKTIVKFANRKDVELVVKSKTKLVLVRKTGEKNFIFIKVYVSIVGSFRVRLRNNIMKDFFRTSGEQMEPYGLKSINIQNLWTSLIYQNYRSLQILTYLLRSTLSLDFFIV